jgi:putative ABC transport system permease protein
MSSHLARRFAAGAFGRDLHLAARRFAREPGLAVAAILTLAVGIGACTSMFSIVQAVVLQPVGVADPERIVVMWPQFDDTAGEFAYNTYRDMQRRTTTFGQIALTGSTNWPATILLEGGTQLKATECAVSGEFFDLLGATARMGRTLHLDDDHVGARDVVVLSAGFWARVFGGDPGVVGRTLTVREKSAAVSYEIVGVMPPEFFYPSGADYWIPAAPSLAQAVGNQSPAALADAFDHLGVFHAVGRLKPDLSLPTAQAEMSRVVKATEAANAPGATIRVGAEPFLERVFGHARLALAVLMGAVLLVLFIACANVAGLLVARGAARAREMAIRAALGATRWSLARQSLAEAALLVVISGALGTSAAEFSLHALLVLSPAAIPRLDHATIDLRVLAFTVGIMTTTTALMGAAASWRLHDVSIAGQVLGSSSRVVGRSVRAGVRQTLVVAQVSLALVLLVASALAVQSFLHLASLDLGFEPSHVLTFGVNGLNESRYPSYAERHRMVDQLLARFDALPQVRSAGAVLSRPFAHGVIGFDSGLLLDGQVDAPASWLRNPTVNWEAVTPRYFETMGIRLIRGRDFAAEDGAHAPLVVIVSELTASRVWPGQDPIGQRLMDSFIGRDDGPRPSRWQTVVGVVATSRYREIDRPWPDLYVPLAQASANDVEHFVVRTSQDPRLVLSTIAAALSADDGGLSVEAPTTMGDVMAQVRAPWHFDMLLFSVFGAVSIGLTAIGVFGLMAYTVSWRRREIGLRIALGAREGQVVRMIVLEGGQLVGIGLAIGLGVSLLATRLMRGLLFNISPTDLTTIVGVGMGVLVVATLACYIPARRVAIMDPSIVFRDE